MKNSITVSNTLDTSTLAELRAFIAETEHMPGSAVVSVRIGFGKGTRNGSRVKAITAEFDKGAAGTHEQSR